MKQYARFFLTVLTISGFLAGQDSPVVVEIEIDGGPVGVTGESDLTQILATVQESYGDAGRLGTVLNCVAVETIPDREGAIRTVWRISESSPVIIDSVVITQGGPAVTEAVRRLLGPMENQVASRTVLTRASAILSAYALLPQGERLRYSTYGDQKVALVVPVKDTGHNTVMGMAGFQPRSGGSQGMTGEIKLHLERLFGTASLSDIWWYRTNGLSQALSLSHEELYLWRFNFGGRIRFHQDFREGLYVARRTELALVAHRSRWGRWYLGGERTRVTVTPEGREKGMGDHRIRSFMVGNERDTRDASWNPSRGNLIEARATGGIYSPYGRPSEMLVRLGARTEVLLSPYGKWTFAIGGRAGYVYATGDGAVPVSELFRYGGASTLRGYREDRFSSRAMAIVQLEWRYRLQGPNRFTLFVDGAIPHGPQPPPVAFGAGIQQKTPLGVLRLEYAVSREEVPSEGKVHLRILGRF